MFQLGKLAIQSTVSTLGTAAIAAQAMTNILENLNGIAAIGVGVGLMTIVGQCLGAGRKDEAVYYIKNSASLQRSYYRKLSDRVYFGQTSDDPWRNGEYQCGNVHPHDHMDHHRKACGMDNGVRAGVWSSCSR